MLELKLKPTVGTLPGRTVQSEQPRKQLFALILLLVTFAALIVKDRDFWFGTDQYADSDAVGTDLASAKPQAAPLATRPSIPAPAPVLKKHSAEPAPAAKPQEPASGIVASNRTALPPLDVEVVTGDKHSRLHPGNPAANLEISNGTPAGVATNAAEREPLSTSVNTPDGSAYPLLAPQMKVQGSVVLQAIISADGNIEDLRVLAGPPILTDAAQQAVRQWRFKPVLEKGQPVETQAKITVNFNIRIADGSTKTTLAESHSDLIQVLSR
ncbi:MAG TPA: TonB family protein [Verrucomicrobiae bacterium]|nr:TonB family protein [Verrucomicrobiae bacterium]